MGKKRALYFLLCIVLYIGVKGPVYAQTDSVTAIINKINSIRVSSHFDTALFIQQVGSLSAFELQEKDVLSLHEMAERFDKGGDLDMDLYIRIGILSSLSKSDVGYAIDYARQNLGLFEKNKGPNQKILQLVFLQDLRVPYRNSDRIGEGFLFYNGLLAKSKATGDKATAVVCYYVLSGFYRTIGLIDVAIYHLKKSFPLIDSSDHTDHIYLSYNRNNTGMSGWLSHTGVLGEVYYLKGDYETSLMYIRQTFSVYSYLGTVNANNAYHLKNMANAFLGLNKLDSAAYYLDQAEENTGRADYTRLVTIKQVRSLLYIKKGELDKAEAVLSDCWRMITERRLMTVTPAGIVAPDYYLALVKIAQHKLPEAALLLKRDIERLKGVREDILRDYKLLGEIYDKTGDHQKAKESFSHYISLQDSLLADQARFRTLSFETEEQMAGKENAILQLQTDNRISRILWIFSLGIVVLVIILASMIYQRYRVKQKANNALEITLAELKNTQSQLVQSEKMASLGELTAGIAHEIQNPLNFVNNFSEVNKELLVEMKEELDKGNMDDAKAIADDVINNQEKITHHGKRADAIVKGMLQHSRSSSGVKEPTDINALADEYLRLAYHGLRAKDKSFNATMKTDFDESIGTVNIIPQDIGRVILNLITNAFYVVDEKKKQISGDYEPTVSVTTKKNGGEVEISVKDNGNGIPQKNIDKIFQPFFTTKPTGQGTGLGLSLSYDIVKAHGGEITVKSVAGESAQFIISLPLEGSLS